MTPEQQYMQVTELKQGLDLPQGQLIGHRAPGGREGTRGKMAERERREGETPGALPEGQGC